MIRKNILSLALLSILGLSHAAEVENLKTISYLNEPLRLHADVIGEGEIKLAAPTEYLRLNHVVPNYDLSINVVESGGKRELILTTTELISVPALTLLLEGRDSEDRKQLFELPILLDFKPDPVEKIVDNNTEIIINGVNIDANATDSVVVDNSDAVELVEVPLATEEAAAKKDAEDVKEPAQKDNVDKSSKKDAEQIEKPEESNKIIDQKASKISKKTEEKVEKTQESVTVQKQSKEEQKKIEEASAALTAENNNALIKRYGPVSSGETLWSIANKVRPSNTTTQKMIEIIKKNNPSAFTHGGVLKANVVLVIPGETKKIQSNFVKEEKPESKKTNEVRIGFIYELPEIPATNKAIEDVIVVEDENKENTIDEPIVKIVKPSTDSDKSEEKPIDSTDRIVNQLEAPQDLEVVKDGVEEIKTVEQPSEPVVEAKKIAPKKPVFVMPEPEEPGIIELVFDNIMYIGAGAGALILAVLGLVIYRRKKDDGQDKVVKKDKPKKEKEVKKEKSSEEPKKKLGGLFGRKKKEESQESIIEESTVIAASTAAIAVAEEVSPQEWDSEELSSDLIVEIMPEEHVESVADLDFDLSSLENTKQLLDTSTVVDQLNSNDDFLEDLDFDLSPLEQVSEGNLDASLEGLSFDISSDEIKISENIKEDIEKSDDFSSLNFDLSFEGLTTSDPIEQQVRLKVEDSSVGFDSLEIDLAGLDSVNTKEVEDDIESLENGFGENNPLFAQKDTSTEVDNVEVSIPFSIEGEESAYVSFSDIMKTAETTSVSDDKEADKPFDFSELLEESEGKRGIEGLLEESTLDDEAKLDFSFVAETEDVGASQSFLDSLDTFGDSKFTGDVISESVKDNIAMTEESMSAMLNISSPIITEAPVIEEVVFAEPVVTEEPVIEEVVFTEPVVTEEPVIEEVVFTEPAITEEPVIEEVVFAEPAIIEEPVIEEVVFAEPVVTEEPVFEEITFTEPVVEASKVQIQEKIVEKEVFVEKVVAVEKPVTTIVEAAISAPISSEVENESEQIKLELAVAYMDFDKNLAKPLLEEVVQDGNDVQVARARELLAQID